MLPKGGEVAVGRPQTAREAARYRLGATRPGSPGALPDVEGWAHFARHAEEAGIESVLISFSRYEPDPFMVSNALGRVAGRLKFIVAYRSGLMRPSIFVQQVNTLSALVGGRVALNLVAGSSREEQRGYGDLLSHDERYARAREFLSVCNSFWRGGEVSFDGEYYQIERGRLHTPFVGEGRRAPEVYVSGHSEQAEQLALAEGTCLLRVADEAGKLRPAVERLRERGLEVCLRACVVCRPTREEAFAVAASLLPEAGARGPSLPARDDSQMYREAVSAAGRAEHWLAPSLWAGLTPHYGPVWMTLLGTPAELAGALLEYEKIGVTQFILSGWPELDELRIFGREVLPLLRSN
jgi:alkanesulfonate monooxygenase